MSTMMAVVEKEKIIGKIMKERDECLPGRGLSELFAAILILGGCATSPRRSPASPVRPNLFPTEGSTPAKAKISKTKRD